ncbi:MAG: obgE [Rickettsiaceae bacterium]|jgi:GTP-binding protein|nr:obgE [Rickettsiaceae bacterium]
MKFLDEAKIYVKSGNGGAGCVSFRREKYVAMGGPNGGNGGAGGSIIFEANDHLNTLVNFRYKQHFKAKAGEHGMGQNRNGKSAEDLVLEVPVGTQIFSEDHEHMIYDFTKHGERFELLKGGKGGLGNSNFKSSINQAPRRTIPAEPGAEMNIWLKLKLISDAGLVGLPNAGKSTFLARVSAAKPKIADYPFTTLTPNLGVVSVDEEEFVMADIPGLIEGAHLGHGLGDKFLKHVERCGVLLHLIDGTEEDIVKSYKTIRRELEEYSPLLKEKQELVCINKCDALQDEELKEKQKALKKVYKGPIYLISGVTGQGITEVLRAVSKQIKIFKGFVEEE